MSERGDTTMDAPINAAVAQLENSDLRPFVVLISDGAVHQVILQLVLDVHAEKAGPRLERHGGVPRAHRPRDGPPSAVKSVTSQGCNTHSDQERFTQCVDMYIALQAVREQQRQDMEMEASE